MISERESNGSSRGAESRPAAVAKLLADGLLRPVAPCRPPDWSLIEPYAARHGLAGLVLEAARMAGAAVPPAVRGHLRTVASQVASRNLHLLSTGAWVVAGLRAAGVEVMGLKGIVLTPLVYPRCDLRPMTDLDLLFREGEARIGCRALERLGCRPGCDLLHPEFFPRFYYEREYFTPGPWPARLDVHARPFRLARYRGTMSSDAMWDAADTVPLGETCVHLPAIERLLLHLCVHSACHGNQRLVWLLDIAIVLRRFENGLDWERFAAIAGSWRLTLPARDALAAVAAAFGPVTPPEVDSLLARPTVTWRDRLALWHAPRDAGRPVRSIFVELLTGCGWREKMAYFRIVLMPHRDHMATIYPRRHAGWLAVAHLWRWVRIPLRAIAGRWWPVASRSATAGGCLSA